jgi:tripartite-type tricarboxylate transporter receptor subunit TctC
MTFALRVLWPLGLAAALGAVACLAQPYPSKPVRYVVTGSPGSSTDALGRLLAEGLSQQFGRQFVVDNRTGGGSNIGPEIVAKAPPDGYTLLQMTISHAVNVTLYKSLAYDIVRDFAPVTRIATEPAVLVVHPSLPVKSVAELIRLAKAQPGALTYSSGGTGTFTFLAAELFNGQAATKMLHVPYKGGGPALTAVIAGEVTVYFAPLGITLPHLHSGRLRPLGVTTLKRVPLTPDLPTIAESGLKDYESGNWFGLMVPAKTPKDVVSALHAAAVAVLRGSATLKKLNEMAYVPVAGEPDELAAHIRREVERLGRIVRMLNLSAE